MGLLPWKTQLVFCKFLLVRVSLAPWHVRQSGVTFAVTKKCPLVFCSRVSKRLTVGQKPCSTRSWTWQVVSVRTLYCQYSEQVALFQSVYPANIPSWSVVCMCPLRKQPRGRISISCLLHTMLILHIFDSVDLLCGKTLSPF